MKRVIALAIFYSLWISACQAATYWVSKSGSDSQGCNASNSPLTTTGKQTIQAGMGCLAAGDTLRIRAGTYSEGFTWINVVHGTSDARITVEANPGEAVTWQVAAGAQLAIDYTSNFFTLRGIKLDGSTGSNCLHHSEGVCRNPAPGTNPYTTIPVSGSNMLITVGGTDNVVENCEFTGSAYGVMLLNTPAVRFTFRNNYVHQVGKIWNANNMYLKAANTVIEGNRFVDVGGGAVSFWNADTASKVVNDVIARNNYIERAGYFWATTKQNGTRTDTKAQITQGTVNTSHGSGISLSRGTGARVYNNIVIDSVFAIGAGDNVENCLIANNSIYGNPAGAFGLDDGWAALSLGSGTSNCQVKNNIVYQPGVTTPAPITNAGANNVFSNNLCSSPANGCTQVGDPKFVDAANRNFRLQASSPAIDKGAILPTINDDIDRIARPQGSSYDIGASEFPSDTTSPGLLPPPNVRIVP